MGTVDKLDEDIIQAVLDAKQDGLSHAEIGKRFGISFKQLERIITEAVGVNVSTLSHPKRIKSWEPKDFRLEGTTVWSFKQRGSWATHDGRYRGNWSPYIPRNLILRYTKPGDLVLDPFVGGGTTAVEAKLLGRRCIARDINSIAVDITRGNLRFRAPVSLFDDTPIYEPEVSVGDARSLDGISDNSVDLICAHPPYAGIIRYTHDADGDLSHLGIPGFLSGMSQVATECFRVLKPGSKCAVLIGDTRQSKCVVPLGFGVIRTFLDAGFILREMIIKRQHNCRSTGFWYDRSVKHNFLLLAHEYLPVFEKPTSIVRKGSNIPLGFDIEEITGTDEEIEQDTATVWACSNSHTNLFKRYGIRQISKYGSRIGLDEVVNTSEHYLVFEVWDIPVESGVVPVALELVEAMLAYSNWSLKEIIISIGGSSVIGSDLEIVHRYLLVYQATSIQTKEAQHVI